MYNYQDIIECLRKIGIATGDDVFIHSNIGFFGPMQGITNSSDLCASFMKAICEVIGDEGTMIVPTFTYSFCHGEVFDKDETPTKCGMLPEYMRKQIGVKRSNDPNFSIAAYGKNSTYYTENPTRESFGENCFWERLLRNNGKIICMNFDCGSTFVHYVEKKNCVDYRYNKAFNGIIKIGANEYRDYFVHYVYDMDKPDDAADFSCLDRICKENNICKTAVLGKGRINTFKTTEYYKLIVDYLKINPRFLTIGGSK